MSVDYVGVITGGIAGAASGALSGLMVHQYRARRARRVQGYYDADLITPEDDERIDAAVRTWADTYHRGPVAARLVADKLRLGLRLQRRRWRGQR
jgi:hypothetical protein